METNWHQFENGNSLGQKGEMDGTIIFDEEHKQGARITIEKGGKVYPDFFCTGCQIYGGHYKLSCHYTLTEEQAKEDVEIIKIYLEEALSIIGKTPPKNKRNYENLSKVFIEIYLWSERFTKAMNQRLVKLPIRNN